MADGRAVTTVSETDYDVIEAAVMETERGRWFLREYARRNRNADTEVLLGAIERLEQAVAGERAAQDVSRLRASLKEMATAISRTKVDIASLHEVEQEHSHLFVASEALDAITRQTEQATSDILAAAEQIQESAWTLREDGANPTLCDDLDRRATDIYTACSFQDLTAQRIAKIIQTLRYLEGRINAMIALWDGAPAPADEAARPSPAEEARHDGLTQSDIDSVIVDADMFASAPQAGDAPVRRDADEGPEGGARIPDVVEAPEPEPIAAAESEPLPADPEDRLRVETFAEIDRLPVREKLRLFT
jgi:chemotaxis regulatin CheY-phosphate phosphatase CheZ